MKTPDTSAAANLLARRMSEAGVVGPPRIAIVTGSGLGGLADAADVALSIPMAELPGFSEGRVAGHGGRWIVGKLAEVPIHLLQGRRHYYEGVSGAEVVAGVRVAARLGVRLIILTNAAGGIGAHLRAGDLMLIHDVINFTLRNPLAGANDDALGPRFPDMSEPFDPAAGAMLRKAAAREKVALKDGVYAAVAGPNYETRAEIEMLRRLGADAVGMSTVPEAIAARHAGVRLAGISTIANLPYRGAGGPTTHEEVLAVAEKARAGLTRLLFAALPRLAMLVESPVFGREI